MDKTTFINLLTNVLENRYMPAIREEIRREVEKQFKLEGKNFLMHCSYCGCTNNTNNIACSRCGAPR